MGIATTDTDGSSIDEQCTVIPVLIAQADVQAWLDLYDPSSSSSPLAADSRKIARAVLDALRLHEGVQ
jgi:hypothetical protein